MGFLKILEDYVGILKIFIDFCFVNIFDQRIFENFFFWELDLFLWLKIFIRDMYII